MDVLTINELMHATRDELCDFFDRIVDALKALESGTAARATALDNLNKIRRVMLRRGLTF